METQDTAENSPPAAPAASAPPAALSAERAELLYRQTIHAGQAAVAGLHDSYHKLVQGAKSEAAARLPEALKLRDSVLANVAKRRADRLSQLKKEEDDAVTRAIDEVRGRFNRQRNEEMLAVEDEREKAHAAYDAVRGPVEEDLKTKLANLKEWLDRELSAAAEKFGEKESRARGAWDQAKRAEAEKQAEGTAPAVVESKSARRRPKKDAR